jgi:glycogen synthase
VCFHRKPCWRKLQRNGMRADFSWHRSVRKYLRIYGDMAR